MTQLIINLSVIFECLFLMSTIYFLNLVLPEGNRNEKLVKPFSTLLNSIYSNNVRLSIFVTILVFLLLIILWISFGKTMGFEEIGKGVFTEAFGMFFDALILVLLFNFMASKGEKDSLIKRYFEEIEDFRDWKDNEAKFRIRGNILRLNKLHISKFDLSFLDLSRLELQKMNFNNSTLTDTDFSYSSLDEAQFSRIICTFSKFNAQPCNLYRANFSEAEIQSSFFEGTYLVDSNFSNAKLIKVDFEGADLRGTNFTEAYIHDCNFNNAFVDREFLENLKTAKITGDPIYDMYTILEINTLGFFQFKLVRIKAHE